MRYIYNIHSNNNNNIGKKEKAVINNDNNCNLCYSTVQHLDKSSSNTNNAENEKEIQLFQRYIHQKIEENKKEDKK